jgi:hypothetical protein
MRQANRRIARHADSFLSCLQNAARSEVRQAFAAESAGPPLQLYSAKDRCRHAQTLLNRIYLPLEWSAQFDTLGIR